MAVTSCKPAHPNRSGDFSPADGSGRIVRPYIAITNAKTDGPLIIQSDSRLPNYGAPYDAGGGEASTNLIVKRIIPRQRSQSPYVWDVDVEYEARTIDGEGADDNMPESQPVDYAWKTIQENREMPVDAYGIKAQTTAGEPFQDAPEAERSYAALTITRNVESFDKSAVDQFVNTLNQIPIFGYAAKEGRIVSIDATGQYDPIYGGYWQETIEIQFKLTSVWATQVDSGKILPNSTYPGGGVPTVTEVGPWDIVKRNAGTQRKRVSSATVTESITDAKGMEVGVADLNPNGTQRTEATGDPYYIVLRPYKPASWAPLELLP